MRRVPFRGSERESEENFRGLYVGFQLFILMIFIPNVRNEHSPPFCFHRCSFFVTSPTGFGLFLVLWHRRRFAGKTTAHISCWHLYISLIFRHRTDGDTCLEDNPHKFPRAHIKWWSLVSLFGPSLSDTINSTRSPSIAASFRGKTLDYFSMLSHWKPAQGTCPLWRFHPTSTAKDVTPGPSPGYPGRGYRCSHDGNTVNSEG